MLVSGSADIGLVLHRALVWTACACCVLVAVSFVLFARDQVSAGSKHQQNELVAAAPTTPTVPVAGPKAQPRRFIDGAASTLTSPFRSIVASDSDWVNHGIPTIFALLVYGGGLGFLARYSRGLA